MADERLEVVAAAIANNAAWCDAVCRTHGIVGAFARDAWTASVRTPPLYPDAITLRADAHPRAVLGRIDAGPGASVKDSFATLELTSLGFSVRFDATWIAHAAGTGSLTGDTLRLTPVDRAGFARWEAAWRDDGPIDVLRPALLDDPRVTVLAATDVDGAVVAGAIVFATTACIAVSNTFTASRSPDALWRGVVAWATLHAPGATIVGYESDADLAAAWRIGFEPVAPLRVWTRDA